MRRVLHGWILIFLVGHIRAAVPDSAAVYYNRGNAAYRQGDYAGAVELYRRAIRVGARHGAVYYNLGNAYFRVGELGRAILNYERSVKLNPNDEDARRNVRFVRLLIPDRVEETMPEIRLRNLIRRTCGRIAADWLAVLASAGLFGISLVTTWWLLGGRRSGLHVVGMLICAGMLVGSLTIAGLQRWADQTHAGIVLADEVEARFEPNDRANVAFVVHEGTKVWAERREGHWVLVHLANGLRGWLPQDAFEMIWEHPAPIPSGT